jgi:hypothetical protein
MAVLGLDLDIIIPLSDIKGNKECFALKLFKYMCDLWDGIDIPDYPLVDFSIILDRPK